MCIPVWEQLATDQFDPWQVVPRQVFTSYSRLSISTACVVINRVGCVGVTEVMQVVETLTCIGRLRKSGGQQIDIISLLLNNFS